MTGGGMTEAMIYDLTRQGLWVSVIISAPLLTVALVVGVVIGLFQALTSVQEMTLTFVPKAGAMIAVFWLSMSFMTTTLVVFFTDTLIPLIAGG
jgi:flagellar biosynthetic protein FliQ